MDKQTYQAYISLLKEELVPALGCTEPIAIAYAAAKCREVLGALPDKLKIGCSGNIIKNVQGVTVPNSGGLKGIAVAATLGCIGGNSSNVLEVLKDVTDEHRALTKELVENNFCDCYLIDNCNNLFIKIEAFYKNDSAEVNITNTHTNISKIVKNGEILFEADNCQDVAMNEVDQYFKYLNIKSIVEFADSVDLNDVKEILEEEIEFNSAISQEGLTNDWGLGVGQTIRKYYDKKDVRIKAISAAAAGSDARMGGCSMPVIINSGSGNQGLTISLPIIEYARHFDFSKERLLRALTLGNLISIQEKSSIGSLSAYCGAVCAGTAAGCGIAYLFGGKEEEISNVITNCLANIGGIVCDGAKPSCAAKIATSVQAGILSFEMGMKENKAFKKGEGLIKSTADKTIKSFGRVGKLGMKSTDTEILSIMLEPND
ncbi:MAG: serine dehydratase subunit alpha family protein [Pleomorphochaeta sp.]